MMRLNPTEQKVIVEKLAAAGLRPTRQRVSLARLLYAAGDRHVTAEQLHLEARRSGVSVSLATIYNTLNQFTGSGLLREVVVEPGRSYFDTNVDDHHHYYVEDEGRLADIPGDAFVFERMPAAPDGFDIDRVDIIVRVRKKTP